MLAFAFAAIALVRVALAVRHRCLPPASSRHRTDRRGDRAAAGSSSSRPNTSRRTTTPSCGCGRQSTRPRSPTRPTSWSGSATSASHRRRRLPVDVEFVYQGLVDSPLLDETGLTGGTAFLELRWTTPVPAGTPIHIDYTPGAHPILDLAGNEVPAMVQAEFFRIEGVADFLDVLAFVDEGAGPETAVLFFGQPLASALPDPTGVPHLPQQQPHRGHRPAIERRAPHLGATILYLTMPEPASAWRPGPGAVHSRHAAGSQRRPTSGLPSRCRREPLGDPVSRDAAGRPTSRSSPPTAPRARSWPRSRSTPSPAAARRPWRPPRPRRRCRPASLSETRRPSSSIETTATFHRQRPRLHPLRRGRLRRSIGPGSAALRGRRLGAGGEPVAGPAEPRRSAET